MGPCDPVLNQIVMHFSLWECIHACTKHMSVLTEIIPGYIHQNIISVYFHVYKLQIGRILTPVCSDLRTAEVTNYRLF